MLDFPWTTPLKLEGCGGWKSVFFLLAWENDGHFSQQEWQKWVVEIHEPKEWLSLMSLGGGVDPTRLGRNFRNPKVPPFLPAESGSSIITFDGWNLKANRRLGWCWNPINNGGKLPTSTGSPDFSHQQYHGEFLLPRSPPESYPHSKKGKWFPLRLRTEVHTGDNENKDLPLTWWSTIMLLQTSIVKCLAGIQTWCQMFAIMPCTQPSWPS